MISSSMQEQWCEYSIGMFVIFLRIFTRTNIVGFRGWQGDDYLIIFSACCYTVQLAMHQLVDFNGTVASLIFSVTNPERIAKAVQGSKENIVTWICYTSLVWSLKGCMLFLYARLTTGLKQKQWVTYCGILVGVTYVAMILMILLNCHPLYLNWTPSMPLAELCKQNLPHFYILGPLNVITDIMLLCIPIPLIYRAHLPLRRKLGVAIILSGGIFIIVATILNNIFSLLYKYDLLYKIFDGKFARLGSLNGSFILGWGVRETFVAVLTVNIPCIKPLFSSTVWLKTKSKLSSNPRSEIPKAGYSARRRVVDDPIADPDDTYEEVEMYSIGKGIPSSAVHHRSIMV